MSERQSVARRNTILGQPGLRDRVDLVAVSLIGLLTLVIGGVRATRNSLWIDEAATAVYTTRTPRGLLSVLWHDGGMGPYYLATWVWAHVSYSDWWLRMFSVVGGACTLIAVYLLVRMFKDRRWSLAVVVLVLIHPQFMINLANARDYTWVMFGALLSFVLLFRFLERGRTRDLLAYAAVNGVLLALSVWVAPILVAQGLWLIWTRRDRVALQSVVIASLVTLVLVAPFLHALLTTRSLDWIPELTWAHFKVESTGLLGGSWWFGFLALGNAALLALALIHRLENRMRSRIVLMLASAIATPITVAAASLVKPSYIGRYMVQSIPLFVLAAVAGYSGLLALVLSASPRTRRVGIVAASVFVVIAAAAFPYRRIGTHGMIQDLRGAARILEADQQSGDRYLFVEPWLGTLVGHYWQTPSDAVVSTLDGLDSGTRVWLVVLNPGTAEFPVAGGRVVSRHPLQNIEVTELRVS